MLPYRLCKGPWSTTSAVATKKRFPRGLPAAKGMARSEVHHGWCWMKVGLVGWVGPARSEFIYINPEAGWIYQGIRTWIGSRRDWKIQKKMWIMQVTMDQLKILSQSFIGHRSSWRINDSKTFHVFCCYHFPAVSHDVCVPVSIGPMTAWLWAQKKSVRSKV